MRYAKRPTHSHWSALLGSASKTRFMSTREAKIVIAITKTETPARVKGSFGFTPINLTICVESRDQSRSILSQHHLGRIFCYCCQEAGRNPGAVSDSKK
jgi:hypothetical protein